MKAASRSGDLYYNIDYRSFAHPLPAGTLYFHAQYRQSQPNHGWTTNWLRNGDALVDNKANLDGADNYVWMDAKGHGQFAGVTMSVLQNQDDWWGEGDDMFFIDGEKRLPSRAPARRIISWAPGISAASLSPIRFTAPRWWARRRPAAVPASTASISISRSPSANPSRPRSSMAMPMHRSDNYYSVAYWYQAEPHAPFPALPPVEDRLPKLEPVGGPGNAGARAARQHRAAPLKVCRLR